MTYDVDDWSDDDSTPVVPCSNCGTEVYEEADSCPVCGEFLVDSSRPWAGKPMWYIALGLMGVIAVIVLFSGALQFL